jgi:hypothetical protein
MATLTLAELNNRMASEMDANLRRVDQEQQRRKANQNYHDFKEGWRTGIIVEEQDHHGNHFVVDDVDRFNSIDNARKAMQRNREPLRRIPAKSSRWKALQTNGDGLTLWIFNSRGRVTFGQKTMFTGSFEDANEMFWDLY